MVHGGVEEHPRNLTYESDLLRRMGDVSVDGIPLYEYPLLGEYSYWNRFVQIVFSSDIRRFAGEKSFDAYSAGEGGRSAALSLKGFLVALFGVVISCVSILSGIMSRPKVFLFGIDRISDPEHKADFRIRELHSFLRKHTVSYFECFHTVFNKSFVANFFSRGRFGFYLESLDAVYALLRFLGIVPKRYDPIVAELDSFTPEERRFVSYVVKKIVGEKELVQFRIRMLTSLIKFLKVRAVFAIDDARFYHDISLAAKLAGIPSYAFQHGHFTEYHFGWLKESKTSLSYPRPDYIVVWSEYWKKELLRLGGVFPESSIVVGGYPQRFSALPESHVERLQVLIPHETDSPKEEVRNHVQKILDSAEDVDVIIKFRPDHTRSTQEAEYGALMQHPRVRGITSLSELHFRPSVAVGVYSSFLYDMVRAEVPVLIMETSMDYGRGMLVNVLASALPRGGGTRVLLQQASETPASELLRRAEALNTSTVFADTLTRISFSCGIEEVKTVG